MSILVNKPGVARARALVRWGAVSDGPWSFGPLDADALLGDRKDNWAAYAAAHLAVDTTALPETRSRYKYAIARREGDRLMLSRAALSAARSEAARKGDLAIFEAAGRLLETLDPGEDGPDDDEMGAIKSADGVEHKAFPIPAPGILIPEDRPGRMKAIVSVFNNVDYGRERIRPGAFAKSLSRKLPKGVWGHDWHHPVAKTIAARELHPGDPELPPDLAALGGLLVEAEFNLETQRGKEAYSDLKFGAIDEFSIGYRVVSDEVEEDSGVRDLLELELLEWSPVLVGMNDRTRLLSVKGRPLPSVPGDKARGASWSGYSREVASAVVGFCERAEERLATRTKVGRVLSRANLDEIASVADAMESGATRLRGLMERARPVSPEEMPVAEMGRTQPTPSPVAGRLDDAAIQDRYINTMAKLSGHLGGGT